MSKVALVGLYSENVEGYPPLGLLYIGTALKKNNNDVKIIHESAEKISSIVSEIERFKPELVGMSVFTGYHNTDYLELSKTLKRKGYKIVWGNAHPSILPEQTLQEGAIDFV
jgi:anaerobic magnesium-protoporphyrin IX monomethyl ester cyclase